MTHARLLRPTALLLAGATAASAASPPPLPQRGRIAWSGDLTLEAPVTVPAGVTLALEPGTRLRFVRAGGLVVRGSLEAGGTPRRPVRIEGSRDAAAPCIATSPSAASLRLEHTQLSGAAVGVRVQGGTATLASCRFERCGVALGLDLRCRATLAQVSFEANGTGLAAANGAALSGRGLLFRGNEKGLDVSNEAAANLAETSFEANGAGARVEKASEAAFRSSRWTGNGVGLEFRQMDRGASVRDGAFEDNDTGVAAVLFGNPDVEGTRFCRNRTAVRAIQASAPRLRRCCLKANGRALDLQKRSDADVEACRLEGNDVGVFADFSSYPRIAGNAFRANRWHVWLGDYQSLDWEARQGPPSAAPPGRSPAGRARAQHRASPRPFSVANNAWDEDTAAEMSAGRGANITRFWDGRDRAPVAQQGSAGAKEHYLIDLVQYLPTGSSSELRRTLPESCECSPLGGKGAPSGQRPRR